MFSVVVVLLAVFPLAALGCCGVLVLTDRQGYGRGLGEIALPVVAFAMAGLFLACWGVVKLWRGK